MAPLFGQQQRQKVQEDVNQNQTSNGPSQQNPQQVASSDPPPLPPLRPNVNEKCADGSTTSQSSQIRKYLVLVHDVICIKFAPLVTNHQSHPYPFAFNNKHVVGSGARNDEDDPVLSHQRQHHPRVSSTTNGPPKCGSNSMNRNCLGHHNTSGATTSHHNNHFNNGDPQHASHHQKSSNHHHNQRLDQLHVLQSASTGGMGTLSRGDFAGSSSTAEVDHSLHALYLYKGFKEANIQCHWNAALSETFRNIEYKGYIVPSTILVAALPKFLSILRTAWSRQMLRSPAGYRIEFLGEIEEVIADPIQKGQFAPLSDSLCWAILELTSLGQEAFVDSIMSALHVAFPTMSTPSRELVFQTLEKLIKERKVYQTSRGYFVVTPDIFRYMVNANFHEFGEPSGYANGNNQALTLDALLNPNDKLSFSHQSWDSPGDDHHHNRCSSSSTGDDMIEGAPSPKLKRHNSLKMIRQRDVAVTQMSGSTRRHSLRLPKSKSCGRMDLEEEVKTTKAKSSTIEHISRAMRSLRTATTQSADGGNVGDSEKQKKNKSSLLSKLFPFRRSSSKPRSEKNANASSCSSSSSNGSMSSPPTKAKHQENSENARRDSAKFISTQTQTSNSTEQLSRREEITLSTSSSSAAATPNQGITSSTVIASSSVENEKANHGRILAVDSSFSGEERDESYRLNLHNSNGDGSHQTRSSSRRSISILDDSPLYDVLQDGPTNHVHNFHGISPNFQVGCPVQHPTFPSFQRGESRSSTLSSQGYGSQGHPSYASNYSPLDSGLASSSSYGYGDGSIMSHSPCGSYTNGISGTGNGSFPQPARPNAYSSQRYKNSYEWYKRRYPNYISPVGRSSPLYASLTAPRSKLRSRPTYESLLTPKDSTKGGNGEGLVQMSANGNADKEAISKPNESNVNTTITQAVKQSTNMELELLLPLGKIMKAALQSKKDSIREAWLKDELGPGYAHYANKNQNTDHKNQKDEASQGCHNEPIKVNLDHTGAKVRVSEPKTKTEITTVVNKNGIIETHFDTHTNSDGKIRPLSEIIAPMHSTELRVRTTGGMSDVVLINGTGSMQQNQEKNSMKNGRHSIATCEKFFNGKNTSRIGDAIENDSMEGSNIRTSSYTIKDEGIKAY